MWTPVWERERASGLTFFCFMLQCSLSASIVVKLVIRVVLDTYAATFSSTPSRAWLEGIFVIIIFFGI